ncbi:MAG TPA: enoyl-CoA hydratase-related protein [Acidimicrobiales bacterium]|nr:enoyl-CoA hydratase-related protein [Acidimicrobiales bacterium]
MYETIMVDVDSGVATVTLNRPDKKNAISLQMEQELHDALWGLEADDGVRAIVVTGAGDAFCSGFDLSGGAGVFGKEGHEEHDRELGTDSDSVSQRVAYWRMATPMICAINGAAVGVGITLPLLMDIRYVAEDAKLSFVFTRRGILPDASSHWLLPKVIGVANALDLLMTGRTITGREAAELGLVNKALPKDEVLPAALDFARDLAANCAPASVALVKRLVYRFLGETDQEAAMALETKLVWWTGEQPDAIEGVMSWMERRPAAWKLSKHDAPSEDPT